MMTKAILMAGAMAAFIGAAAPAAASSAQGYSRPVDIPVLNFFLSHTYEYYSGYGWASFGGSSTGGNVNQQTSTIYGGESSCMSQSGNLTYAITGVCHQGTNRGLYETPINYVYYWTSPNVDGSGVSYSMFCHMGAWFDFGPCDSPPC